MSLLVQILIWVFVAYLLISLIFYFFQHYFFFRPEILPHQFMYNYPFEFEEHNFDMEDGGQVNSILFKVPNSRGVIYYFKGNSRSIKGWGKFAKDFVGNGFDFFMMDYRGFGKSRGKRTEDKLYHDAQQIYRWLNKKYAEDQIILFGRSYGTGIAARIASWNNPALLILDAPYFSFRRLIYRYAFILPLRWLLRYQIPTYRFLKKVDSDIHIIHGTKDRLIPLQHSEQLQALDRSKITLHRIKNGRHNNLPKFPEYHKILYQLINGVADSNRSNA